MKGAKHVVWILVATIVGAVAIAHGETRMMPLNAASKQSSNEVINSPDIHGMYREGYFATTSLGVRNLGGRKGWLQSSRDGAETIAQPNVDIPDLTHVEADVRSTIDLNPAVERVVPRTIFQGDAFEFSPRLSAFLSERNDLGTDLDTALSAVARSATTMDWVPRFKEQAGTPAPGTVPGPSGLGETTVEPMRQVAPMWRVVPFVSVAERYDSNVFFTTKEALAGLNVQQEDYVTSVIPQLAVLHAGKLVQGRLQGGATSEFYVQNPDLNYTGYNGQLFMDLTQAVRQVLPNARSLVVNDSLLYTPQLSAFLQGGPNFFGLGDGQNVDTFGRGIQAFRINAFTNAGSAQGFYSLTPTTDLGVGYTNALLRFSGGFGVGSPNQVFNTTIQTINGGPLLQLSPRDTLNLGYFYTRTEQTGFDTYKTHTAVATWRRVVSPFLGSSLSGGATMFEEFRNPSGMTLVQSASVFPNAAVSLVWRDTPQAGRQLGGPGLQEASLLVTQSMTALPVSVFMLGGPSLPPGGTAISLNYSVGVFPSFLLSAGPMISHTVWFQGSRGLTDRLGITGGVNYGQSEAAGETSFSFGSLSTNLAMNYLITPTLRASVIHTFGNYQQSFGGMDFEFDRQTAMFTLTYLLGDTFGGLAALPTDTRPGTAGVERK